MLFQQHEHKEFLSWMRENEMMFTGEEYHFRMGVYHANKRFVQEHNRANLGYILAVNRFAHLTHAEYASMNGFRYRPHKDMTNEIQFNSVSNVPDSCDWRDKKVCNEIQHQDLCGSCWTFSAIQAVESAHAIKSGKLMKLSEQNLLDCVTECDGCHGGIMDVAYDHVIRYQDGRFMSAENYPYVAEEKPCRFSYKKAEDFEIIGYTRAAKGREDDLAAKVAALGPFCVAINAHSDEFKDYAGGIFNPKYCPGDFLTHAVGCVGFGSENGMNYWIIRNSWGTWWGENGYGRIAKDKDNKCGIANYALIPVLR